MPSGSKQFASSAWLAIPEQDLVVQGYRDRSVFRRIKAAIRDLYNQVDYLLAINGGTPQVVTSTTGQAVATGLFGDGTTTTFTIDTGLTDYKVFWVQVFDVSSGRQEQASVTMLNTAGQFQILMYSAPARLAKRWAALGVA